MNHDYIGSLGCIPNEPIRSNGLEMSQFGTQKQQFLWILAKTAVFSQNPHFCLNLQEDKIYGFLCETKDHLPKKITPIFLIVINIKKWPLIELTRKALIIDYNQNSSIFRVIPICIAIHSMVYRFKPTQSFDSTSVYSIYKHHEAYIFVMKLNWFIPVMWDLYVY